MHLSTTQCNHARLNCMKGSISQECKSLTARRQRRWFSCSPPITEGLKLKKEKVKHRFLGLRKDLIHQVTKVTLV